MKRLALATSVLVMLLSLVACNEAASANSADVTIAKAQYEQLKADAERGKQVGRYQLQNNGATTWRLDTSTGDTCLLLATAEYWKREGKNQRHCSQVADDPFAQFGGKAR